MTTIHAIPARFDGSASGWERAPSRQSAPDGTPGWVGARTAAG